MSLTGAILFLAAGAISLCVRKTDTVALSPTAEATTRRLARSGRRPPQDEKFAEIVLRARPKSPGAITKGELKALSAAQLKALLEGMAKELTGDFDTLSIQQCKDILTVLQGKDPAAVREMLDLYWGMLSENNRQGLWRSMVTIFLEGTKPSRVSEAVSWLQEHREWIELLDELRNPEQSSGWGYRDVGETLALAVGRKDPESGLQVMQELDLRDFSSTLLPELARVTDSPQIWARILQERNSWERDWYASSPGIITGSNPSVDLTYGILDAAAQRVMDRPAADGIAWLEKLPLENDELETILGGMPLKAVKDPERWLEWMGRRFSPSQIAKIQKSWIKQDASDSPTTLFYRLPCIGSLFGDE